jgi:hypothetical protein
MLSLFHKSKLFRLEPFGLRNVVVEPNQTILNNRCSTGNIRSVDAAVGVLDCPDPTVTYTFYPVSHMEHTAILLSNRFKIKNG